jgi:glycosyltransferase involved in cell wall biosynthesis
LANALSKICDVTLILPKHADRRHLDDGVRRIEIGVLNGYASAFIRTFDFHLWLKLFKQVKGAKPDVVHILTKHPWSIICLLAFRRKLPIISTIHDPVPHKGERMGLILSIANKALIRFSDKLIVLGKGMKDEVVEMGAKGDRVEVIRHGDFFFTRWAKGDVRAMCGNVLFFGRIEPYKGIEYLIRSAELIGDAVPGLKVTIAGRGDMRPYARLIRDPEHFEIINHHIPDERVAELFQNGHGGIPQDEGGVRMG